MFNPCNYYDSKQHIPAKQGSTCVHVFTHTHKHTYIQAEGFLCIFFNNLTKLFGDKCWTCALITAFKDKYFDRHNQTTITSQTTS